MLLASVSISESALAAYFIISEGQYAISISFNLWIGHFRPFVLEDPSLSILEPLRTSMLLASASTSKSALAAYSIISEDQYAISISFNLQISSHRSLHDFSHFLNASTVLMCFYKSHILFTVLDIRLYTFFHKHVC